MLARWITLGVLLEGVAVAAPLTLTADPLVHGETATLHVQGAQPGGRVRVLRSREAGVGARLPGGERLGLMPDLRTVLEVVADGDGEVHQVVGPIDPSVPVADGYLQAVAVDGLRTQVSNVLRRPVFADPPSWMDDAHADGLSASNGLEARLCRGEVDRYTVVVPPGEVLAVAAPSRAGMHAELRLVDEATQPFRDGEAHGLQWHNTTTVPMERTLEVRSDSVFAGRCEPYTLMVATARPRGGCVDDAAEPDDQLVTARTLVVGSSLTGMACDVDWVQVEADRDGELVLGLDTSGGRVEAQIHDARGQRVAQGSSVRLPVRQGDRFFVAVEQVEDDRVEDGAAYVLSAEVEPPCTSAATTPTAPLVISEGRLSVPRCAVQGGEAWLTVPSAPSSVVDVWLSGAETASLEVDGVVHLPEAELDGAKRFRVVSEGWRPGVLHVEGAEELQVDVSLRPWSPCADDAWEPSDGLTPTPWDGEPLAATACDEDVYTLDVPAGATLTVSATWLTEADTQPITVAHEDWVGVGESVQVVLPTAESVQVIVPPSLEDGYVLRADLAWCSHVGEPDSLVWLAQELVSGQPVMADACESDDWYTLQALPGDVVDVVVQGCVQATDDMGVPLGHGCGTLTVQAPGRIYLRVDRTDAVSPYTLTAMLRSHTCQIDDYEPNGIQNPVNLDVGAHTAAVCPGDEDWFEVPMAAGEVLSASLEVFGEDYAQLAVFDAQGHSMAGTMWRAATSGVWRLGVTGVHDVELDGISYVLDMDRSEACPADAHEPNSNLWTAPFVQDEGLLAEACPGDTDWWMLRGEAGRSISSLVRAGIRESALPGASDGAVSVRVQDLSGQRILSSLPADGLYRLQVDLVQSRDETPGVLYRVEPGIPDQCPFEPTEPDDTLGDAREVRVPSIETGRVCLGDTDLRSVWLEAGETLVARLELTDAFSSAWLDLFDSQGGLASTTVTGDGFLSHTALVSGEVHVSVASAPGWATDYELLIDTTPCAADAYEPDDRPGQATMLTPGAVQSAVACPGNPDVFALDVVPGQQLSLSVDSGHPISLAVTDASGRALGMGDVVTWTSDSVTTVYATVEFSMQSRTGWHVEQGASYAIEATVGSPCLGDSLEPNDHPSIARVLDAGLWGPLTVCTEGTTGADWYRLPAMPGERVEASVDFDPQEGDVDLLLYDATGQLLTWSAGLQGDEQVGWDVRTRGPLFLRVELYRDAGVAQVGTPYTLGIERF